MTAALSSMPARTRSGTDTSPHHLYCCDENVGLCGTDLSTVPITDDDTTCVVCLDLEDEPCCPTCPEGSADE